MKKAVKDLVLFLAAVVIVFLAAAIGYSVGYRQSTEDGQEPMENEIRLVQEHTAEKVFEMFTNYPSLREDLMNYEAGVKIYRTEIPWWNFDREFTIECNYGEVFTHWCDLQR